MLVCSELLMVAVLRDKQGGRMKNNSALCSDSLLTHPSPPSYSSSELTSPGPGRAVSCNVALGSTWSPQKNTAQFRQYFLGSRTNTFSSRMFIFLGGGGGGGGLGLLRLGEGYRAIEG